MQIKKNNQVTIISENVVQVVNIVGKPSTDKS